MKHFKNVVAEKNGKIFKGIAENPRVGASREVWMADGEHRVVQNNAGACYISNSFNQTGVATADLKIAEVLEDAQFPEGSYAKVVFS